MKRMFENDPIKCIIIGIVIFSVMFMLISTHKSRGLDVYTDSDRVEEHESTEEKKKESNIDSFTYTDEENHFSIDIPQGWNKINNDGVTSFVHPESGSTLQLEIKDYDPNINMHSEGEMSSAVAESGNTFLGFNYITSSHYELIYQTVGNTIFDYLDEVFWNTEKEVHLKFICDDQNYEGIKEYYDSILNSFQWGKDANGVIDNNYVVYYNSHYGFQFAYPGTWTPGTTDSTFYATDEGTGNSITVYAVPYTESLDKITPIDIMTTINPGGENFAIRSYTNNNGHGHLQCDLNDGTNQHARDAYVFADGINAYFLVFDYTELDTKVMDKCAEYFKSFAQELKKQYEEEQKALEKAQATATTEATQPSTETAVATTETNPPAKETGTEQKVQEGASATTEEPDYIEVEVSDEEYQRLMEQQKNKE